MKIERGKNMEKSLQEVLSENRMKMWEKEKARIKKEKRKETILAYTIGTFIVMATVGLLILCNSQEQKSINSCVEAGHSYNTCVSHS
jgi:hypothetical protein